MKAKGGRAEHYRTSAAQRRGWMGWKRLVVGLERRWPGPCDMGQEAFGRMQHGDTAVGLESGDLAQKHGVVATLGTHATQELGRGG